VPLTGTEARNDEEAAGQEPHGATPSSGMTLQHERLLVVCALVVTTIAVAVALYWLKSAMIPFVLALLFSFALSPLLDFQTRNLQMPAALAVPTTLALGFLILTTLAGLVSASVSQLTASAATYQAQIEQIPVYVQQFLDRNEIPLPKAFKPTSLLRPSMVGNMLLGTTNAVLATLSQGLLVLIFLFFFLAGRVAARPSSGMWAEVESRIKRFLVTKASTSAATGLLVWILLSALGIELALVFGLFAFLLNFIPSVGSVIATLLPLPVVLFSPDVSTTTAVLAIALPAIVQFSIGNIIEPNIMGSSLDLHPVAILLSLVVWGTLWGIVGMLLATPITAVMKILFERLEITAPLAELLAGRIRSD
jgi:AI-2 transport protein TqsA